MDSKKLDDTTLTGEQAYKDLEMLRRWAADIARIMPDALETKEMLEAFSSLDDEKGPTTEPAFMCGANSVLISFIYRAAGKYFETRTTFK